MRIKFFVASLVLLGLFFPSVRPSLGQSSLKPSGATRSLYDYAVADINGEMVELKQYAGSVVVIVNTASKCGFAPQLKDLESLYNKYKSEGLVVLGFPSNDFLGQEPLDNVEIKKFCSSEYGVTFPLFAKNPVTGEEIQPVFKFLTKESGSEFEGSVKWNFEKFVVDRKGKLRARYGSFTNPMSAKLQKQVEALLREES